MSRHPSATGALLLAAALVSQPRSAQALIVSDGKIVRQWPDDPTRDGVAFAEVGNIHLYPSPQGEVWGLTLLVDFSDQPPAFTKAEVEEWLNQTGFDRFGCNGSVRDYFADVSNGHVDFQNDVFGYYRAQNPKSYYEGGNGYERAGELMDEVLAYFDDQVDFSKYDNDGDGDADSISVVYAGFAVEWGQGLWPHAGSRFEERDGVELPRYMMTDLRDAFGLYTFSHEVGHMLFGWPDLYGFGNYCIMGNGASPTNPPGINDLYRADQGWIPIVDVQADTNAIYQAEVNGAGYRLLNPERSDEAFFWSNVRSSGRFDTIEGDGLLLLHFDKGIGNNDPPNPLSLAVVQADGKKDLDQTTWPDPGSDAEDYFHAGAVDEFAKETHETARWNDGTESGLRIYDVGPIADTIEFKVGYGTPIAQGGTGADGGAAGTAGGAGLGGAAGHGGTGAGMGGAGGIVAGSAGADANLAGQGGRSVSRPPVNGGGEVEGGCACRQARGPQRSPLLLAALALSASAWRRRQRRR